MTNVRDSVTSYKSRCVHTDHNDRGNTEVTLLIHLRWLWGITVIEHLFLTTVSFLSTRVVLSQKIKNEQGSEILNCACDRSALKHVMRLNCQLSPERKRHL